MPVSVTGFAERVEHQIVHAGLPVDPVVALIVGAVHVDVQGLKHLSTAQVVSEYYSLSS